MIDELLSFLSRDKELTVSRWLGLQERYTRNWLPLAAVCWPRNLRVDRCHTVVYLSQSEQAKACIQNSDISSDREILDTFHLPPWSKYTYHHVTSTRASIHKCPKGSTYLTNRMNRVSKGGKTNARKKQDETQRHLTTTTPWHLHLPPGSLVTGFETTSSAGSRDGYPAQGAGARIGVDFNARVTSVTLAPATRVPG